MPLRKPPPVDGYDIYPAFPMASGDIMLGFDLLARKIRDYPVVLIDGYTGVLWPDFRARMENALQKLGVKACWKDVAEALRPQAEIDAMAAPFLGGDDPLFGTRTTLELADFFDPALLASVKSDPGHDLVVIFGTGAFLSPSEGLRIYLDVPKNEIQYRARAGSIANLGCRSAGEPKAMYKRSYFVDWIVLNKHKARFCNMVDVFADLQRPAEIAWSDGDDIRAALDAMSVNYFRVRPWFEPGTWGGNWILDHIGDLSREVPNYAWSFELIVPENGLIFESGGTLMELSFDWLMYRAAEQVLGTSHPQFGCEFPIRFDFLDTFGGGNLSVQCHPFKSYMTRHFGEHFTQEETYYILDAAPGAGVYLGFTEDIDPAGFRHVLEDSFRNSRPVAIEKYLLNLPSHKHDLFLIPPGTVHGSGINNLVLEISSTPYIFTFKLYDWLRPDLDGKPRPLNIERGMQNLDFERRGDAVTRDLISRPVLLETGPGWELWHLPTHTDHLYDVHRYEFESEIIVNTEGKCHVLSLVEGSEVTLLTAYGMRQCFRYAETFVVPAAAGFYRVINNSPGKAVLVKAFVK